MTRLLVVAPGFHGYGRSIADAFSRNGFETHLHEYDAERSRLRKAWNKGVHELPAVLRGATDHQSGRRVTRLAAQRLRSVSPDLVLVVRGDTLGDEFWDEAATGGRRVGMWWYDEMRRMRLCAQTLSGLGGIATYSAADARELNSSGIAALHVRTGFDDHRTAAEHSDAAGLLTFIGAPLPRRAAALQHLVDAGLPVTAWGRGWSDHPLDRARTWRLRGSGIPNERDVPYDQALAIMRDGAATLNVHGDQDGFTMRTYESCGVGGVQLIDRADVADLYEPGREVLVFRDHDELTDLARQVVAEPKRFEQMRRRAQRRTLAEHTLVQRARELEAVWQ